MYDKYMSDELFEELLESVREAKAIMRGERKPLVYLLLKNPMLSKSERGTNFRKLNLLL